MDIKENVKDTDTKINKQVKDQYECDCEKMMYVPTFKIITSKSECFVLYLTIVNFS